MAEKIYTYCVFLLFTQAIYAQSTQPTTTAKKPLSRGGKVTTTTKSGTTTTTTKTSPTTKPSPTSTSKPTTTSPTQTNTPKTTNTQTSTQPSTTTSKPAQTSDNPTPTNTPQAKPSEIEAIWINGSLGGGLVASTNIVNSGALIPFNGELLFHKRHKRMGIGIANELYVTPEALVRAIMGQGMGVKKLYFSYELFLFRHFPVNFGISSHVGFFGAGNDSLVSRGGIFANTGLVVEAGYTPLYFFVRPYVEYKNWGGMHKELITAASVGVRFKFLTDYEIKRRAEKKLERQNRR